MGPVGPAGAAGPQGVAGPQGQPGPQGSGINIIGSVSTDPNVAPDAPQNPQDGNVVIAADTGHGWVWNAGSGTWIDIGQIASQVPGPQGPPGVAGSAGQQGPVGPVGPIGATGATGPAGPNTMPMGVTDGSDALPGQVGEYKRFSVNVVLANGSQQQMAGLGPLPAGDWDIISRGFAPGPLQGLNFYLPAAPPGVDTDLGAVLSDTAGSDWSLLLGSPGRALVAQSTNFSFTIVSINPGAAITLQLQMTARRAR